MAASCTPHRRGRRRRRRAGARHPPRRQARQARQGADHAGRPAAHASVEAAAARDRRRQHGSGRARDRLSGAGLLARLRLPRRRDDRHRPGAARRRRWRPSSTTRAGRSRPAHEFGYDTLVIAVGSLTNDFGTPGVKEHAIALETAGRPARFHRRLVNACIRAQHPDRAAGGPSSCRSPSSAPARPARSWRPSCTRPRASWSPSASTASIPDKDIKIDLIEAAPRILPALPERLSKAAVRLLEGLGVRIHRGARWRRCWPTACGWPTAARSRPSWWCGRPASRRPTSCKDIAGLETNRLNQLVVRPTLQTTRDDDIFALGDCAACPWPGHERPVPPRAQAAHQQASHLAQAAAAPAAPASRCRTGTTAISARWSRSATIRRSAT